MYAEVIEKISTFLSIRHEYLPNNSSFNNSYKVSLGELSLKNYKQNSKKFLNILYEGFFTRYVTISTHL